MPHKRTLETVARQEEKERGRRPAPLTTLVRGGVKKEKKKKGSNLSSLPLRAAAAAYLPPSSRLLSIILSSFPYSSVSVVALERKDTCRSLMIQPFCCLELLRHTRQHVPPATAVPARPVLCTSTTAAADVPSPQRHLLRPSAQVSEPSLLRHPPFRTNAKHPRNLRIFFFFSVFNPAEYLNIPLVDA